MNDNALLSLADEPDYRKINPSQIAPALQAVMQSGREVVANIKALPEATWANTIEPLTDMFERLERVWGVVSHLNSVVNTPELRDAYQAMMPEVTTFFTEVSQDLVLFERFKAIRASAEYEGLSPAQQRKLENNLRDFVLSGADLPETEQKRFADIQNDLAKLGADFSQNVLDATDAFALYFDDVAALAGADAPAGAQSDEEKTGLPDYALAMFAAAAEAEGKSGYKITLQFPHYLAVMQYAHNRDLRAQMYRGFSTRASEFGAKENDNTDIISQRLRLTREEAQLLGFNDYAELSLATKMADTPAQVVAFLQDLAQKAKPFAQKDMAELTQFAQETLGFGDDLQAWDLTYAGEKLREAKFSFSEQEVKQYFPINKVLSGLFGLINKLYGIDFVAKDVPVWHDDVRYFELHKAGEKVGAVYMDLYAREGKRGGAWMNDYRGRRSMAQGLQTPTAYLVCNFTPAVAGQVAHLTHDEIVTLFHEMGHGLHHLLTQVDELGVSGINGVEWDAVELPSQFMENFAWELSVLQGMSEHEDSGAVLPEALYNKMIAAKNFQSGMQTVRQIEFALFDMRIYQEADGADRWAEILQDVRSQVAVVNPPAFNRFAQSFSHIFAGGYAAGYYSYKWAEVLSCDAYAAFEETDDVAALGQKFWQEILAVGGSRSAMDSFVAFRGRAPSIEPLLRFSGMAA
ncbi:MAG: M3 family metallopeptidase [Neisseriaceae bacterium]|nr:M3 family metallopeptidase [Neisseriaceae bacterium]